MCAECQCVSSVSQRVAVCCSVLQCVAVCGWEELEDVMSAECRCVSSVLQRVAMCCSMLQCVIVFCSVLQRGVLQCVAVCRREV